MINQTERWWAYHTKNPEVYDTFVDMAMEAFRLGRTRIGAWLIFQVMRWNNLKTTGEDFRYPNGFIALYARYFLINHPEFLVIHDNHIGRRGLPFFELRPMIDDPFADRLRELTDIQNLVWEHTKVEAA